MNLVVDWDGTVTETDTLWMVVRHFGDPDVFLRTDPALERGATLREVMEIELGTVRAPLDEVLCWLLPRVELRAGFL